MVRYAEILNYQIKDVLKEIVYSIVPLKVPQQHDWRI